MNLQILIKDNNSKAHMIYLNFSFDLRENALVSKKHYTIALNDWIDGT